MKTIRIIRAVSLLLLAAAFTGAAENPRLRLAGGDYLPLAGKPAAPGWYDAPAVATSAAGKRYLVAIARGPLDEIERLRLEQAGAELLDVLPVHGYRLRAAPESEPA